MVPITRRLFHIFANWPTFDHAAKSNHYVYFSPLISVYLLQPEGSILGKIHRAITCFIAAIVSAVITQNDRGALWEMLLFPIFVSCVM